MDVVEVTTLASVAEIVMGTSPRGSSYNHEGVGEPLLNGPTEFGPRHPRSGLFTTEGKRFAEPGDLLFCVRGSTTGRMNWADRRYAIGRGIAAIRGASREEMVFIRAAIELALPGVLAGASGATMPNLNVDAMRRIPVPLHSERALAGSILAAIDDLIDNNRRRVALLEEMARAIYREWFVHFLYPGHESVPLVDSSLGPIPAGWRAGCVKDLVTAVKGTVDPRAVDASIPAVGLEHIPRRQITLDAWGAAGDLGSRKAAFAAGDILFCKIRPYFHKVSIAPLDGICSTDAIVLRPHVDHWGQAVLALSSDEFVAHAVQTSNGTKMPRADWKVIGQFPTPIPPVEIGSRFSRTARDLLEHARSLMFQGRSLAVLRDLLLPRLVTGEIDVSSLDLESLMEGSVG